MIRHAGVAALVLLWIALVLASAPWTDVPLNDDWAYAQSARHLLMTGELRLSDWSNPIAVFPAYWGALFCLPFGFSHVALRASTLSLGLAGLLAFHGLLRELGFGEGRALFGAALLAINPLYLNLACTYMTDVPFLALSLLALLCYVKGLEGGTRWIWLGSAFAALAGLTRQLGWLLPVALTIVALRRLPKPRLVPAIRAAALVPALACVACVAWMSLVHGPTHAQLVLTRHEQPAFLARPDLPAVLARRALSSLQYLGWFAAPTIVAAAGSLLARPRVAGALTPKRRLAAAGWILGAAVGALWLVRSPAGPVFMPYLENIVTPTGFCPSLEGEKPAVFPAWIWPPLTLLAALSVMLLGALRIAASVAAGRAALVYWAAALMAGPSLGFALYWDDYLLPFVPAAILGSLEATQQLRLGRGLAILSLSALAVFSVLSERDYFAWAGARWQAGERLLARGVPLREIDGGFEWNGWMLYEHAMEETRGDPAARTDVWAWQRVLQPRYLLAFSILPEAEVVDRVSYAALLPPRVRHIFVMRRPTP